MKLTQATLKKLIKEELEEMQNTDSMRDFETEIGVLIEKAIALAMEARLSRVEDILVSAHEELMGL
jgi:hypothetical protein